MRRWRIPWLVVTVEGVSMAPTYVSGDRLLVRRIGLAGVPPGAAVLLVTPGANLPGNPPFMVKRAVALPGDPVPPGIPVSEAVVPPGWLVVLGDNRGRSADSRFYGFQPGDTVVGVVRRRLMGARRYEQHGRAVLTVGAVTSGDLPRRQPGSGPAH